MDNNLTTLQSILKITIFACITFAAFFLLFKNLRKIIKTVRTGKSDARTTNPSHRIKKVIKIALFQNKILRDTKAGAVHIAIFWGFLVLLFSAGESVIQGFIPHFSLNFLKYFYTGISFLTDIFCILIVLAVIVALFRRFVIKVPRLQGDAGENKDAAIVLCTILIIVLSLMINIAASEVILPKEYSGHFINYLLQRAIESHPQLFASVSWWIHILSIFAFMNYLPFSKHLHVYFSIPNVYFSDDTQKALKQMNFEDETIEKFGAKDIRDLSWKSIFDSYTCTHCGRCTAVCPANQIGMELDPRNFIIQIRKRAEDIGSHLKKKEEPEDKDFANEFINKETLWECTTCGACMQECPVNIEHIPAIMEFRRGQLLMESDFPAEFQTVYSNLENNASPWAFPQESRLEWAVGLNVKQCRDNPNFEFLYWVGCAGAFDEKAKKTSQAMIKILDEAGINYAVLGNEEKCNGDIARRTGNEYLADMMIKDNIEILKNYNVKKIITTCPHCYNTFKNEYPAFGLKTQVIHHTELINNLLDSNKLNLKSKLSESITYHDSCYLGRYNNIYKAPREILNKINSADVPETQNNSSKSLCCGAGGGGMFKETKPDQKINIKRAEELIKTGCDTIALNCPFCHTMLEDATKAINKDKLKIKDIAELVAERL